MVSVTEYIKGRLAAPLLKRIDKINETLESRLQSISSQIDRNQNSLEIAVNMMQQKQNFTEDHVFSLKTAGLAARSLRIRNELDIILPEFEPSHRADFDETLQKLAAVNQSLYPVWRELFENGARSYVEERLGSCSHREHKYAQMFAAYLEIYGHGRILDVGCGPYGLPSYLATRKSELVSGLEPLPMISQPAFEVVRGFNEFLPWNDAQFDTVVSATSLDHVLSLEKSLNEVRRVLRPSGKYVVWLASIPGAEPFDERKQNFIPIDQFHLFHFDREWVEPIFERFFLIEDITVIPQPGFDHVFYCMSPR